jgi:hypothetical protein
MDSGPYRFYMKWLYPIESAVCQAWPGLLAFTFMALGEPATNISSTASSEREEHQQPV